MIARVASTASVKHRIVQKTRPPRGVCKGCTPDRQTGPGRALHTTPPASASSPVERPRGPCSAHSPVPRIRTAPSPHAAFCMASPGGTASWALCPFLTVNASRGRVPFGSCGSSDEPGAFQELDENSVHECVLDQGLHQHHSLLPQHVQHPWDV